MINRRGFTLVELIVVIVVIAILATLASLGLTRYQIDAKDSQRNSRATIISEALEKYYLEHGEYPSCNALTTSPSIVVSKDGALPGLDQSVLVTPKADASITNSISCSDLTSTTGDDYFAYVGDSSDSCQSVSCLEYTLKYWDEASGTIKTISSRHKANVNTSGSITVEAGSTTYTTANVVWNSVPNATGYILQRDTTNAFNSASFSEIALASTASNRTYTDAGPNTTYYYRIKATSSTGDSNWSNILSQKTTALPVLALTNNQIKPDQVTESWNTATGINSYTIQRATTNSFSSPENSTTTATSKTYSDTPIGSARYYRVRTNVTNASGTTFNGPWSNTVSYTSSVPAPTSDPSIAAAMSGTNAVGTSGVVSCTQTATPVYSMRETHKANSGYGDSWTSWTAWSTTNRTLSVAGLEGHQHKFQANAACLYAGVYSTAATSDEAATVRGINQPASPTWPSGLSKSWKNMTYGHYMWYGTYCPAGTWVADTWFHSKAWNGASPQDYYHNFGFDDWWGLGPSGGANVEYWARYWCTSSYTSSGWSPESYDVIWVYM